MVIFKVKHALAVAGFSPEGLVGAVQRAVDIGSPMGITMKAVLATIRHAEENTGLKIPMDVEGADYLALLSSNEIALYPEYLEALAKIFDHAGVSWTLSSDAYEATNAGLQIGNKATAGLLVQRVVDGAEKLKVKNVISPECGHAYTALRWEGPNFLGKAYPFRVVHILELLDELQAQWFTQDHRHGNLIASPSTTPVPSFAVAASRRNPATCSSLSRKTLSR